MCRAFIWLILAMIVVAPPRRAEAQAVPVLRWADLPQQAASWPPAWGTLVRDAAGQTDFEAVILKGVADQLAADKPTPETYRIADVVLSTTLRHHRRVRRGAPLADNPSAPITAQLTGRLASVRKDWLRSLQKSGSVAEALGLADAWLPVASADSPVRTAILALWLEQARGALAQKDFVAARRWLDRAEDEFPQPVVMKEIADALRGRAHQLLKESQPLPDAPAQRMLEEALAIWPRLPGGRDALERRRGTYRPLIVAVQSLPEQLSPVTAATEVERQSLELLFDRLYRPEQRPVLGKRYVPQLATALPDGGIHLRRDAYWSSGERLTAADIRHTALLMNQTDGVGRSALWRDYLEMPRVEGNPFNLRIGQRQGLFDPLAPLTFWILPQYYRGKQLQRGDDADFAKAPLGSGPYSYTGRKLESGKPWAIFHANPYDLGGSAGSPREIRMFAWTDASKDFPKPPPHLVLDVPPKQRAALRDMGYRDVPIQRTSRVFFLAINHRKPGLTSVALRRAMAQALDRRALLNRHFRSESDKDHTTANGLFPHDSWASAPPPRVPGELFQPEQARSFAKQIKKGTVPATLTLKYPAGDARVKAACEEIATAITEVLRTAQITSAVQAQPLAPHDLRKALNERDYDLLYTSETHLDDPIRLALFFDRQDDATRAGGANYLGYDNDFKLQELLRSVTQHRRFATLQENMQALHVHLYETMPVIPLWQLDMIVMAHPTLQTPGIDPRAVFKNVRDWKVLP